MAIRDAYANVHLVPNPIPIILLCSSFAKAMLRMAVRVEIVDPSYFQFGFTLLDTSYYHGLLWRSVTLIAGDIFPHGQFAEGQIHCYQNHMIVYRVCIYVHMYSEYMCI